MGSALGLVTNANVCFPNSLILCGFRLCLAKNFFRSLKPTNLGRFLISTL
uniref:Uncharacterized protein n=1 Tax=Stegastes partitus TaxID=144197 RepID=A0A3B5AGP8_9TELE